MKYPFNFLSNVIIINLAVETIITSLIQYFESCLTIDISHHHVCPFELFDYFHLTHSFGI